MIESTKILQGDDVSIALDLIEERLCGTRFTEPD